MAHVRVDFIGELVARAAAAGFGGIAALQHETIDHAVIGHVVVIAAAADKETRTDKQTSRWLGADQGCSISAEQTAPRRWGRLSSWRRLDDGLWEDRLIRRVGLVHKRTA